MWGRVSGEAGRPVRRGQAHPADREHVRQHHRRNPGDGGQDEGAWDDQHRPVRESDSLLPSVYYCLLTTVRHSRWFDSLLHHPRAYMEDSRAKIQPLVEQVQAEATKLQEQVKPYISNIEEHIRPLTDNFNSHVKPLTDNFHEQVKPLTDMMEKLFQQVVDQSKALLPPQ